MRSNVALLLSCLLAPRSSPPAARRSRSPFSLSSLSSIGAVVVAEATTASSTAAREREERRRRRERRERERAERERQRLEREREARRFQNRRRFLDGNEEEDDGNNSDGTDVAPFALTGLFVTRKPRDFFQGLRHFASNSVRGVLYGLAGAVASPLGGLRHGTAGGAAAGLVTGAILGLTMPLAGFAAGIYQLVRGMVETPEAILDGFAKCKVYDEERGVWEEYKLDDDVIQIEEAIREEERRNKERIAKAVREEGTAGGRTGKVKDAGYYDLLGVATDASSSDVRAAYRKRARAVHPDKNPDDPDAERKFRELTAAYQTLSDPQKRRRYDASGVGVDPERPSEEGGATLDPVAFFAVLFGSERVEPYVGDLGVATALDALVKLANRGSVSGAPFETWDDLKGAFGWTEDAPRRRRREARIAVHLRGRAADYVDGLLAAEAFRDGCWEEAKRIARGGEYGASFLLAIGPALVAEANAFLGYRASLLTSWRGPVSNAKRNLLSLRRKWGVTKSILRTLKESFKALYNSADVVPTVDDDGEGGEGSKRKGGGSRVTFSDQERLRDNLSATIPAVLEMAWAINFVDISTTLHGACRRLFYDADVSSWEERLLRAEAVHILGSQFYLVGMEVTGGNTTLGEDVEDIKARASEAFVESLKRSAQEGGRRGSASDEM